MTDIACCKPPRRNRPARLLCRLLLIGLVLLLLGWLILAIPGWGTARVIRTDLLETLNAPILESPEKERAWPSIRTGLAALGSSNPLGPDESGVPVSQQDSFRMLDVIADLGQAHGEADDDALEKLVRERLLDRVGATLGDPGQVRTWFEENQPVLTDLREAVQRPVLGIPYWIGAPTDPDDRRYFLDPTIHDALAREGWPTVTGGLPGLEIEITVMSDLRLLGRLLCADASVAVRARDGARAVADLVAAGRLADLLVDRTMLIEQLCGHSIRQLAVNTLVGLLTNHASAFTDADLETLERSFASDRPGRYAIDMTGERLLFEDLLQRVYSDDGSGDGVFRLEHAAALGGGPPVPTSGVFGTLLGPFLNMYIPSRREANDLFAEHLDLIEQGSLGRLGEIDWAALDAVEDRAKPRSGSLTDQLRSFPISLFMVGSKNLVTANQLGGTERAGARVAVALLRYRRLHGGWPPSLEALVPDLLPSSPRDPYAGAPLRYAVREGAPLLWSIGANRVDDEGSTPGTGSDADVAARRFERPEDAGSLEPGDWILWRGPVRP